MTLEQLRKANRTRPFKPFTLHLADGNAYEVKHPEFVLIPESGRTIAVSTPDGVIDIIDVMLVTSIHITNGQHDTGR